MTTLITRPRYEETTHYLYVWTKDLITSGIKDGSILNLETSKVTRKNLESYLKKNAPNNVIINGHGSATVVTGQDGEIIIESLKNDAILGNANVYLRACECALDLGKRIVANGAQGFIGYSQKFMFPIDPDNFMSRPLEDRWARPCMDASNAIIRSLPKNSSAREAHEAGLAAHEAELANANTSEGNPLTAMCLAWNMAFQTIIE